MKTLYLGLTPPLALPGQTLVHYPVISIQPIHSPEIDNALAQTYTHVLFTSKTAVRLVTNKLKDSAAKIYTVGTATAQVAEQAGFTVTQIAIPETAEGMVELLKQEDLSDAHLLWPRSAQARAVIGDYCKINNIRLTDISIYSTQLERPTPVPSLLEMDQIVFTSPSTIDGFFAIFDSIPPHISVQCIGPITRQHLSSRRDASTVLSPA
ncbi:MAG: uroporphyrinogen-III synthase [Chlamydiales bacterium]|nr:uroporphyrinogen-III synthase [Chlamydiales bacterium]